MTHNKDLSVARRHRIAVPMLQPGCHECMALGSINDTDIIYFFDDENDIGSISQVCVCVCVCVCVILIDD